MIKEISTTTKKNLALFFCSAAILLLETMLIRFIPSYVINFNYYTNFVLLAAFLGIGVGLVLGERIKRWQVLFPWLFTIFILLISLTRWGSKEINAGDIILLEREFGYYYLPSWLIVSIAFIFITLLFILLGSALGMIFKETQKPLTAYAWDLGGSLLGVASFFVLSYFKTPPAFWFSIFFIFYLLFCWFWGWRLTRIKLFLILLVLFIVYFLGVGHFWSPYYKITLERIEANPLEYWLFVNDLGHQNLYLPQDKEYIYFSQYQNIQKKNFDDILIIGAGAGNDAAIALAQAPGAKSIEAVEIDPKIAELGKKYHPAQPYSDSRVKVIIDDGRHYLSTSNKKYDMIILAQTDSLTQVSQQGAIRLESYLFTRESFEEVREHLKADGIFVLYNYYWKDWLVDKIAATLLTVFDQEPYVIGSGDYQLASFITSQQPLSLTPQAPVSIYHQVDIQPATDDWPFIYLRRPYLPQHYLIACLLVIIFSLVIVGLAVGPKRLTSLSLPLFFTGAAFMLLETTAIARFSLLFGTTWIVNSAVIFALLLLALAANYWVIKIKPQKIWLYSIILFILLLVNYLIPLKVFLNFNPSLRYFLASLLLIGPIFFAGVIFSKLFSQSDQYNVAFGSNLLGAMVGGVVEYLALITGYSFLILIIALFYLLSLLSYQLKKT